ncbi:MAG: hypothetical protein WCD86_07690 [Ktedonobacteraceae bacterium]
MTRAERLIGPAWGLKQQKLNGRLIPSGIEIFTLVFDMARVTMPRHNPSPFSLVPIPLT